MTSLAFRLAEYKAPVNYAAVSATGPERVVCVHINYRITVFEVLTFTHLISTFLLKHITIKSLLIVQLAVS